MKTISINLYSFSELSEEAKQKAIEKERHNQYERDYILDCFHDEATEKIIEAGFIDPKLSYSLNNCQGDGLSFSAASFSHEKLCKLWENKFAQTKNKTFDIVFQYVTIKIKGNTGNHYCYASKNDIELDFEYYRSEAPNVEKLLNEIEEQIKDIYFDLCKELEKQGYEELEYLYSDEYLTEYLSESDLDFTENGNIY